MSPRGWTRRTTPGYSVGIRAVARGALLAAALCASPPVGDAARAEETRARGSWPALESGPLQDNSFLIEEAYNQEAGVVQHIVNAQWDRKSRDWQLTFTQEWPLTDETNQVSFTVPYSFAGAAGATSGVGDVLLNYRRQVLSEDASHPACAPRLSLVLPTGAFRDELGSGSAGVATSIPLSKQLGDHWAAHANLGATVLPAARAAGSEEHRLASWGGGGSVIWEPADAINFLAELVASRDQELDGVRRVEVTRVTFDPGVRVGWNGPAGIQWVWGVGLPIGLTRHTDDFGVFLYFSAEHAVTAEAHRKRSW